MGLFRSTNGYWEHGMSKRQLSASQLHVGRGGEKKEREEEEKKEKRKKREERREEKEEKGLQTRFEVP